MKYRGFDITAEVETYDAWTIDDDGNLVDWSSSKDGLTVTGYDFNNTETGESFFETMSESDGEELRGLVDAHCAGVMS